MAWMLIHHPTMKRRVTCPRYTTHATWGDPIISSMPKLVLRGAKVERAKMQQGTKRVPITPVILRNKQTLMLLWLPEIRRDNSLLGWLPEINSPWVSRLQGIHLSVFNVSQSIGCTRELLQVLCLYTKTRT